MEIIKTERQTEKTPAELEMERYHKFSNETKGLYNQICNLCLCLEKIKLPDTIECKDPYLDRLAYSFKKAFILTRVIEGYDYKEALEKFLEINKEACELVDEIYSKY
jgi:hypothetical protein